MLIVLNIELIFCLDFFWTVTMNATRGAVDACGWQIEPAMSGGDISSLRYLDLITYPFLLLLATVGNFFTLMVLGRADKGRSRSKGTYIIAIAIADVTFMYVKYYPSQSLHHQRLNSPIKFSYFICENPQSSDYNFDVAQSWRNLFGQTKRWNTIYQKNTKRSVISAFC